MIVEIECIFTQLVFEHSLRIRLKTDALDEKSNDGGKTTKEESGKSTGAATPSLQGGSSSSTGNNARQSDGSSETLVDSNEPAPEGGHAQAKAGHLVGKMNNLISSDLQAINTSHMAVTIREYFVVAHTMHIHELTCATAGAFLQIIVSVWFLYQVLGWRLDSSPNELPLSLNLCETVPLLDLAPS